jgi:8-oxo-dGTP pyrophosphatase MutT (NUDIX family)
MENIPENISIEEIRIAMATDEKGKPAHNKFLPSGRSLIIPSDKPLKIKESAVLVLLIRRNDELCLCLTLRNQNLKHHPGQISFPGGKIDKDEYDYTDTALRELHEETGIDKTAVLICGKLSDLYVQVSNFLIHPVVGYLDHEPLYKKNHDEVAEIIIIPFKEFFRSENRTVSIVETHLGKIEAPGYSINGHFIWGATAMIISEFTERLFAYFRQKK